MGVLDYPLCLFGHDLRRCYRSVLMHLRTNTLMGAVEYCTKTSTYQRVHMFLYSLCNVRLLHMCMLLSISYPRLFYISQFLDLARSLVS